MTAQLEDKIQQLALGDTLEVSELTQQEQSRLRSDLALHYQSNTVSWRLAVTRVATGNRLFSVVITKVDYSLTSAQKVFLASYVNALSVAYAPETGDDWLAGRSVVESLKRSSEYQMLFGTMEISEAWDRYVSSV